MEAKDVLILVKTYPEYSAKYTEIAQALKKKETIMRQLDMFEDKKDLEILPVRFLIHFRCESHKCNGHVMSILDWEFAQLYRNVRNDKDWTIKFEKKIKEICGSDRDTYLILGNMAKRPHFLYSRFFISS